MIKQTILSVLCWMMYFTQASGQDVKLESSVGVSWRSTAHRLYENESGPFSGQRTCCYDAERGLQGFGIDLGFGWNLSESFQLEYNPRLRHDYAGSSDYEFILDHNVNMIKQNESINYGVGYSYINGGKTFIDDEGGKNKLGFSSYNVLGQIDATTRLMIELKAIYIPKGFYGFFPEIQKNKSHMAYALRVFYLIGKKH